MIKKVIHCIWLSNEEYPQYVTDCLKTWDKLKENGFEIKLWKRNDFDFDKMPNFVKEMYDNGLYAFASDYLRLYILYNYGGIYLDMDMEILKPYDNFVLDRDILLCGDKYFISGAIIGCVPKHPLIARLKAEYERGIGMLRIMEKVITPIITKEFPHIYVFPFHFFAPTMELKNYTYETTEKTYSIHHSKSMWKDKFIEYKGYKDNIDFRLNIEEKSGK